MSKINFSPVPGDPSFHLALGISDSRLKEFHECWDDVMHNSINVDKITRSFIEGVEVKINAGTMLVDFCALAKTREELAFCGFHCGAKIEEIQGRLKILLEKHSGIAGGGFKDLFEGFLKKKNSSDSNDLF